MGHDRSKIVAAELEHMHGASWMGRITRMNKGPRHPGNGDEDSSIGLTDSGELKQELMRVLHVLQSFEAQHMIEGTIRKGQSVPIPLFCLDAVRLDVTDCGIRNIKTDSHLAKVLENQTVCVTHVEYVGYGQARPNPFPQDVDSPSVEVSDNSPQVFRLDEFFFAKMLSGLIVGKLLNQWLHVSIRRDSVPHEFADHAGSTEIQIWCQYLEHALALADYVTHAFVQEPRLDMHSAIDSFKASLNSAIKAGGPRVMRIESAMHGKLNGPFTR